MPQRTVAGVWGSTTRLAQLQGTDHPETSR